MLSLFCAAIPMHHAAQVLAPTPHLSTRSSIEVWCYAGRRPGASWRRRSIPQALAQGLAIARRPASRRGGAPACLRRTLSATRSLELASCDRRAQRAVATFSACNREHGVRRARRRAAAAEVAMLAQRSATAQERRRPHRGRTDRVGPIAPSIALRWVARPVMHGALHDGYMRTASCKIGIGSTRRDEGAMIVDSIKP
jgi:hypothetical protein